MRSISFIFCNVLRSFILLALLSLVSINVASAQSAAEGAVLFKQKCTSCHALNQKVIGPALKGILERRDEAWLIPWIKNSQAVIASGDAYAVKLYKEYNQSAMTAFPELSDNDVKSILVYIKEEGDKPATPAAGTAAAGASQNEEVSSLMIGGIVVLIIIAFLVILVLNRVNSTLESLSLKKQGIKVEEEVKVPKNRLAQLKKLGKNKKIVFFVVLCKPAGIS
mgnify:FL=1